jgi:hypothetical protein
MNIIYLRAKSSAISFTEWYITKFSNWGISLHIILIDLLIRKLFIGYYDGKMNMNGEQARIWRVAILVYFNAPSKTMIPGSSVDNGMSCITTT